MYPGLHKRFPNQARKFIMHGLGENWSPGSRLTRYERDSINAQQTGILWIDLTAQSKKHTLFLLTPFSKRYPWKEANLIPSCNGNQAKELITKYSRNIIFIVEASTKLHLSMGEVCENNPHFPSKPGFNCGAYH